MTVEPLDAEDAKLVVLARSAMARAEAGSGAAVRDADGRTYSGAPVGLSALQLTALQTAVAAAVSSGAAGLEAACRLAMTRAGIAPAQLPAFAAEIFVQCEAALAEVAAYLSGMDGG